MFLVYVGQFKTWKKLHVIWSHSLFWIVNFVFFIFAFKHLTFLCHQFQIQLPQTSSNTECLWYLPSNIAYTARNVDSSVTSLCHDWNHLYTIVPNFSFSVAWKYAKFWVDWHKSHMDSVMTVQMSQKIRPISDLGQHLKVAQIWMTEIRFQCDLFCSVLR